jgi:competence protein ComEC
MGSLARDAEQADAGVRLLVDASEIHDARGPRPFAGRVQLFVAGELARLRYRDWTAGRPVRVWASLRPPRMWRNPGSPSPEWQTLVRPYAAAGSVKSGLRVQVVRAGPAHEAAAAVRRLVRDAITRYVAPHDRQTAAVVTAILIGDRAGLDAEVERRLQKAGTYHVIAISGGNVAMLMAVQPYQPGTYSRTGAPWSFGSGSPFMRVARNAPVCSRSSQPKIQLAPGVE